MVTVERRAAVHAALGEPVRLTIVDRLGPGDVSPGELAAAVGLGTNLLAHHLKVLEQAGVIRRVRSEGDKRRSYVQLCLDDQVGWAAAQAGLTDRLPAGGVPRRIFAGSEISAWANVGGTMWRGTGEVPAESAISHAATLIHAR